MFQRSSRVIRNLVISLVTISALLLPFSFQTTHSQSASPDYKNASLSVDERVADLLTRMTVTEKKAQQVRKYGIGQIARQRERKGPREGAVFANSVQKWLIENTRLGIPAMFHDEILHGHMAQGSTSFPQPISLASSWDPDLVTKVFTVAAQETRARGSHQVLGPNLDLARDPRWGRTEETYGEDPYLVSRLSVAILEALQGPGPGIDNEHVIATAKHFT